MDLLPGGIAPRSPEWQWLVVAAIPAQPLAASEEFGRFGDAIPSGTDALIASCPALTGFAGGGLAIGTWNAIGRIAVIPFVMAAAACHAL